MESGTKFLSIIDYPKKRQSDIINLFTTLDFYSLVIILSVFLILILLFSLLIGELKYKDSTILIYRIFIKEHHLTSSVLKYRLILTFILIYHFLLTILIEATVGSQLIVSESPKLFDTVDDLYHSSYRPIFIANHYSTGYFRYSHENSKLKSIYDRALKCGNRCFRESRSLLSASTNGISVERKEWGKLLILIIIKIFN